MRYDGPIVDPAASAADVWRSMMHRADARTEEIAAARRAAGLAGQSAYERAAEGKRREHPRTPRRDLMQGDNDKVQETPETPAKPSPDPADLDRNNDGNVDKNQQQ